MKKLISLILSFAMLAAFPLVSFAIESEEEPTVLIYDFDGNLVENPDLDNLWKYGAIFNADGTIDEEATIIVQSNIIEYVNSTKTLAPGKYWQSYQYQVSQGVFLRGTGACAKRGVFVERYFADSVGGERELMESTELETYETGLPYYLGNVSGYINFIYRNTSTASREFNIHIYVD